MEYQFWHGRQISDKYKCIFVHVPKVAGTSIEKTIFSENKTELGYAVDIAKKLKWGITLGS